MITVGIILLSTVCAVQGLYLLVFSRAAFHTPGEEPASSLPGVSIVVCAWNELENLQVLIPVLQEQNYPEFEIVVVNDRSTDGTYAFLQGFTPEQVRVVTINRTPSHISAKKYAVTLGIQAAKYDVILLTDADCRPASPDWVRYMAGNLSGDIVLGYSPYFAYPGFLNTLIQFETFYTALQYLSFALAGAPYMGVGRNLMYRKSFFLEHKGFHGFLNVLGGDDDLFVNKTAKGRNTTVSLHPDSFVWSVPKQTKEEWSHQKRRHLSVGKLYKKRHQFLLGMQALSHAGSWAIFVVTAVIALLSRNLEELGWILGIFGVRTLLVWLVWSGVNRKLGSPLRTWQLPLFDLLWAFYLSWSGFVSLFSRKTVSWK
ncbi:glycosyltransferase [Siphonobacter aquaeclarae]|uniref:Glycosyltransferase, catalytic subunit of cellulose synthase and poly-beta-1,6-N-acetylglucosamine synthase n=1 Tax=Siphonobacter aquaeclarae TaxID=563176 RepID=A0A1G9MG12_9BACT|nr:glycosyltransferase [Siphonobacter aquaeclarae]SDL73159.1 Glycosyltransferase, catalytic subunit of cellulose synthase and poly-beta-1,6-N-acetylglucosamine synthase [Siphonobacter aquaeclarae]